MTERVRCRSGERCFPVIGLARLRSRCLLAFIHGGIFIEPPMNE